METKQLLNFLALNKKDGYEYRKRRHDPWNETYGFYRGVVQINRLTQRQSVHLPLMKSYIRTLLKDVDDLPVISFQNKDNDDEAQNFANDYWTWTAEQNFIELKDIQDKKQVLLFGRTFKQLQIVDGRVTIEVIDPNDILVSRYTDPTDLDSSRYLIHTGIFRPLSKLKKEKMYDKTALKNLEKYFKSDSGIQKSQVNEQMMVDKNKKMVNLGVDDANDPMLGETYVELTLHFCYPPGSEELHLVVEAEETEVLMDTPLEEVIGPTKDHYWQTHFPYDSWADDLDRQDFWTDGAGDILSNSQKVTDSWYSQLAENRTLRNYGMQFYDSTAATDFQPNTFEAKPFGWYGVPGDPNKILKRVEIGDLSESIDEMQFVINLAEKALGATATQQGAQVERQVTLGEVQLALGEAKERIKGMSKFYTQSWKTVAYKFLKLVEAAPDRLDAVKLYKKGRNSDKLFMREVRPKDWMKGAGYLIKIWSQDEKNTQNTSKLEKLNAAVANIPNNPKLMETYQRTLLEFADVPPDTIKEIMDIEKQKLMAVQNAQPMTGQPLQGQVMPGQTAPVQPQNTAQAPKRNPGAVKKLQSLRSQIAQ